MKVVIKKIVVIGIVLLSCMTSLVNPQTAATIGELKVIGEVALVKGVVTAQSQIRPVTTLEKGSPIYLNDTVETASRSFLVIKFTDGGKATLRPESRLDIDQYNDKPGEEQQSFELLKGGLRAITGAIGKAQPEKVKYTAQNTTIGIRGTTLVIKLCDESVSSCRAAKAQDSENGLEGDAASKQFVEIFVVDKSGGSRKKVSRQQLQEMLSGVYVSVIDGAVRVESNDWYADMAAGDKCLVDYSGGATISDSSNRIECFTPGPGLEDIDVYLSEDAENITVFNVFDGSEINVGGKICEIN